MQFQEQLDQYMRELDCSGKELAEASGLSAAIISRYRSGSRLPSQKSDSIERLAQGLHTVSQRRGRELTVLEIRGSLERSLLREKPPALSPEHFSALLGAMEVSPAELAQALSYDASYISRVRSGQRSPADAVAFAEGVSEFICTRYSREACGKLLPLMDCQEEELTDGAALAQAITEWLLREKNGQSQQATAFLTKLDDFDLEEYIEAIHFRDIRLPSFPVLFPNSKTYYGVEQMKLGELDFLKLTVLSRQTGHVFMCSDMPMEDMAQDGDFAKKWMFGLAAMLKKGLELRMVHNLNRPFAEMMLGLESWIPLYMTGQVRPYYLPGVHNSLFCRLLYVSDGAALAGECLSGSHDHGKYELSRGREELRYYRQRETDLMKKAQPLMEIFRKEEQERFAAFLLGDMQQSGRRHGILSVPPIYTISPELLAEILERNGFSPEERADIERQVAGLREMAETILARETIFDELHALTPEEFQRRGAKLSLSGVFCEKPAAYTYEEYRAHLALTERYAETHSGYRLNTQLAPAFHNIQISILEGRWAVVSKEGSPVIHFVIRHPRLREAIEQMVLPMVETEE